MAVALEGRARGERREEIRLALSLSPGIGHELVFDASTGSALFFPS